MTLFWTLSLLRYELTLSSPPPPFWTIFFAVKTPLTFILLGPCLYLCLAICVNRSEMFSPVLLEVSKTVAFTYWVRFWALLLLLKKYVSSLIFIIYEYFSFYFFLLTRIKYLWLRSKLKACILFLPKLTWWQKKLSWVWEEKKYMKDIQKFKFRSGHPLSFNCENYIISFRC